MNEPTGTEPQEPTGTEPTEQTPEQKRIAELEASVGRLEGALTNERDAHKATKTKAQTALSEEEQAEFDRLREEEQKRKGKELVPRAEVTKMVEEATKEPIKKAHKERDTATAERDEALGTLDRMVLKNSIHDAVGKVTGVQPSAVQDIIRYARSNEEGVHFVRDGETIVLQNENGVQLPGPDGEGNLQIEQWLEQRRESHPHWFVQNQGGGPGPGTGGGGAPQNGKKPADMTPSEKAAFIREHGQAAYLKLAGVS